jgi:hypothetical protein
MAGDMVFTSEFGRDQEGFAWERTDRAEALARALG